MSLKFYLSSKQFEGHYFIIGFGTTLNFSLKKKLKISVKDFWPPGDAGGPEKRNIFQKKGYYLLLWRWSYNNNGKSLTLYSVLLVINIRNVMFTKIPQSYRRYITQQVNHSRFKFALLRVLYFFPVCSNALGQFSSII